MQAEGDGAGEGTFQAEGVSCAESQRGRPHHVFRGLGLLPGDLYGVSLDPTCGSPCENSSKHKSPSKGRGSKS